MEFTSEWLIRLEKPEIPLEKEMELFNKYKQEWIDEGWEGKWMVVHDGIGCGPYTSFEEALEQGYEFAGLEPFLVKQILTKEKVYRC